MLSGGQGTHHGWTIIAVINYCSLSPPLQPRAVCGGDKPARLPACTV